MCDKIVTNVTQTNDGIKCNECGGEYIEIMDEENDTQAFINNNNNNNNNNINSNSLTNINNNMNMNMNMNNSNSPFVSQIFDFMNTFSQNSLNNLNNQNNNDHNNNNNNNSNSNLNIDNNNPFPNMFGGNSNVQFFRFVPFFFTFFTFFCSLFVGRRPSSQLNNCYLRNFVVFWGKA